MKNQIKPGGPVRIALSYMIVASLWILLSDRFVASLDISPEQVNWLQTYKGWGFVLGTGLLLYLERKWSEAETIHSQRELQRLNRALRVISDCNQTIIRANEERNFLHELCHLIVDKGSYKMAWIGFARHDEAKRIQPVAQAGFEAGYLEQLNLTWADTTRGRGPTGMAIRTGQVAIAKNIPTDPHFAPWRAEAIKRGYASSISIPLALDGQQTGALNIYAAEPDAFDEREIKLLQELADDVAYGITSLRLRIKHDVATEQLQYQASLLANVSDAIISTDLNFCIISWNKAAEQLYGWRETETLGHSMNDIVQTRYLDANREDVLDEFSKRGRWSGEVLQNRKDGSWFTALASVTTVYDDKQEPIGVVAANRDITARKQTEAALRESEHRYRAFFSKNHAVILIIDPQTGAINDANAAACTFYGYDRATLTAKKIMDINTLTPEQTFQEMERAKKAERRHFFFKHRLASGEIRDVEVYSGPIETQGKSLLFSIVHDITERVQAEKKLDCLYSFANFIEKPEVTLDEIYQNAVQLIPPALRYPEITAACLSIRERDQLSEQRFATANFIETPLKQTVPIVVRDLTIGQLTVCYREEPPEKGQAQGLDAFLKTERELIDTIATRLGRTSERHWSKDELKKSEARYRALNEQLEQRVMDRTRELSALYEVTAIGSELHDLEVILDRSLERVIEASLANAGTLHLLDETGQMLYLAASQNFEPDGLTPIEFLPANHPLVAWIFERNEPLIIPDITGDDRVPQAMRHSEMLTYIGVPIHASGTTIGILAVLGEHRQHFNVEEIALLSSTADQVGIAVENARLRRQIQQAAVMAERSRLARELHDSVTQSLYSMTLFAEAGLELAKTENRAAVEHNFVRIGETAQTALKEMRILVHELRPLGLAQVGLVGALHRRLNAVEERLGIKTRLFADDPLLLSPAIEQELYGVVQEALNNTLKHAGASSVEIRLHCRNNVVMLQVEDDGTGFDAETAGTGGGKGLIGIRERVDKLGGTLQIESEPAQGTKLTVQLERRG